MFRLIMTERGLTDFGPNSLARFIAQKGTNCGGPKGAHEGSKLDFHKPNLVTEYPKLVIVPLLVANDCDLWYYPLLWLQIWPVPKRSVFRTTGCTPMP